MSVTFFWGANGSGKTRRLIQIASDIDALVYDVAVPPLHRGSLGYEYNAKVKQYIYQAFPRIGDDISTWSTGQRRLLTILNILFYVPSTPCCLDEPETSLHPSTITVLACAIKASAESRDVYVATHSPILLDQFSPSDVYVVGEEGLKRINDLEDIQELLEHSTWQGITYKLEYGDD